jgi:hypothetical protein
MVLWRTFCDDVMHCLEDVAPLMMSVGFLDARLLGMQSESGKHNFQKYLGARVFQERFLYNTYFNIF